MTTTRLQRMRSTEEYQQALWRAMTERQLYEAVHKTAVLSGWLIYHTHDSRRSYAGYPDVSLCRAGRLWFMELKREGQRPTTKQKEWIDALNDVPGVSAAVIYPHDLDRLVDLLTGDPGMDGRDEL